MGQAIEVEATAVGDVAVFDTDRSITGQDGQDFESLEQAEAVDNFAAGLAVRLFSGDGAIGHVFAASNAVTVQRTGGWDDAALHAASSVIEGFFRFYRD